MLFNCTNCGSAVELHHAPSKGDPTSGEAWVCMKCPEIVCTHCYVEHSTKHHPELYRPKTGSTGGGKKKHKHKK